ncbi:methylated-DNA--[protein]-cysteine S-methyltransferase [Meridianimarinicoccus aquatilis]|uniref:methylated-DNA--[protein]-cysteine S-methyltransferase n=1 Tax=Meridianimarinicoccus aquatilis TaxID=2552766 RepID=A0A4R6ABV0_9RHOB|nr:bifunctional helix-turn-helix domain-containing protein/methylated-DNA--[protein]-cysteine S-methyltransferase [Fluviibacterium aquatile]TDL81441.1 methylated-DNA--[protein]-cysteine S-methyltransferase [Fluviibacterium aquatile]
MNTPQNPGGDPADSLYHYQIIARAIRAIDDAGSAPLPLADLAHSLHMSPAHFQRVFSQWAGVSPKRYQQYLTLGQAKAMLAEHGKTLAATNELGLSSQSRLHDLFLRWEAMSPGEYARGGECLTIACAQCDTPFGPAIAMATDKGLCGLAFAAETGIDAARDDLTSRWPRATFTGDPDGRVAALTAQAMDGGRAQLHLIGAPFQIKVWEALMQIPSGTVTTYSDIAAHVCTPRASRAVGTAVGRNPVSFLIPCHRVLRKDGALGGYHWGLPVKRAMLAWESARRDAGSDGPKAADLAEQ